MVATAHQLRNAEQRKDGRAGDREERQAHDAYCNARTSTEPVGREEAQPRGSRPLPWHKLSFWSVCFLARTIWGRTNGLGAAWWLDTHSRG